MAFSGIKHIDWYIFSFLSVPDLNTFPFDQGYKASANIKSVRCENILNKKADPTGIYYFINHNMEIRLKNRCIESITYLGKHYMPILMKKEKCYRYVVLRYINGSFPNKPLRYLGWTGEHRDGEIYESYAIDSVFKNLPFARKICIFHIGIKLYSEYAAEEMEICSSALKFYIDDFHKHFPNLRKIKIFLSLSMIDDQARLHYVCPYEKLSKYEVEYYTSESRSQLDV